jgi:hypothetical protein
VQTECNSGQFAFEGFEKRAVVASFDGGAITSDAGALLLRETDRILGMSERVAGCFTDHRDQTRVDHTVQTMVAQRIHGIALGYEDLNDHDDLRHDPVLALHSTTLEMRSRNVAPLAGRSTLNRLEHAPGSVRRRKKSRREKMREAISAKSAASSPAPALDQTTASTPAVTEHRYHKISHAPEKVEALFVDFYLDAHRKKPPKLIVLDPDGTDDPIHGNQEGSFFHGYYDCYCYIPLYIFSGRDLLAAKLRSADADGAAGAREEIARIVTAIRARWPKVKIIVRADSGFCRDDLLTWCEQNRVEYVIGLPWNSRLDGMIEQELQQARAIAEAQMQALPEQPESKSARVFKELRYRTRETWSAERRTLILLVKIRQAFWPLSPRPSGQGTRPIHASSSPRKA